MRYSELLRTLSAAQLIVLLKATGRQAREGFFARHHVRAPKVAKAALSGDKTAIRGERLHAILATVDDEPLAEELLRQLFLRHRPLLAAALDILGIAHDDGLTDDPKLARFASLTAAEQQDLATKLEQQGIDGHAHARIYVAFMHAQMTAQQKEQAAAAAN